MVGAVKPRGASLLCSADSLLGTEASAVAQLSGIVPLGLAAANQGRHPGAQSRRAGGWRAARLHVGEVRQLAGAVAELLGRHPDLVEQRELQVGQRRVISDSEMPAAL